MLGSEPGISLGALLGCQGISSALAALLFWSARVASDAKSQTPTLPKQPLQPNPPYHTLLPPKAPHYAHRLSLQSPRCQRTLLNTHRSSAYPNRNPPSGVAMVSFSCEVCLLFPFIPLFLPHKARASPVGPQHRAISMSTQKAYHDALQLELWECPHQEETRSSSGPMSRRVLHLLGLHGALPRYRISNTHCKYFLRPEQPSMTMLCMHLFAQCQRPKMFLFSLEFAAQSRVA